MGSHNYGIKKTYYAMLAEDPDYPAWEEFERRTKYYAPDSWAKAERMEDMWVDGFEYRHKPKPKQWQPPIGGWIINLLGNTVFQERPGNVIDINFVNAGLTRQTMEAAERDLALIRKFSRLLAWIDEQGGYQFERGKDNYLVYFNGYNESFCNCHEMDTQLIASAYMSKPMAEKLCAALNNGEIEF